MASWGSDGYLSSGGWGRGGGWGWQESHGSDSQQPKKKAKAQAAKAKPKPHARPPVPDEEEEEAGRSRRLREENRAPLREELQAVKVKLVREATELSQLREVRAEQLSQLREVRAEHVAAVESGTEYKTMWSLQCNLSAANGKLAAARLTELDEETAVASKEARAHEAEVVQLSEATEELAAAKAGRRNRH